MESPECTDRSGMVSVDQRRRVLLNHRGFVAIRMLNQVELSQRHLEILMFFVGHVGLALPRSEVSVTICGAPGGKGIPLSLRSGLHGSSAAGIPKLPWSWWNLMELSYHHETFTKQGVYSPSLARPRGPDPREIQHDQHGNV
jgi:hypothetical protein